MRLLLALLLGLTISSAAKANVGYTFDMVPAGWTHANETVLNVGPAGPNSLILTETLAPDLSFATNGQRFALSFEFDTHATLTTLSPYFTVQSTLLKNNGLTLYTVSANPDSDAQLSTTLNLKLTAEKPISTNDFVAMGQAVFRSDVIDHDLAGSPKGQIAAPEPASLALLGMAVGSLRLVRRKRPQA